VTGSTVYWADSGGSADIESVPVSGGAATTVASDQDDPVAIVADGRSVCWANQDSIWQDLLGVGPGSYLPGSGVVALAVRP
jgi:hypothetical protein